MNDIKIADEKNFLTAIFICQRLLLFFVHIGGFFVNFTKTIDFFVPMCYDSWCVELDCLDRLYTMLLFAKRKEKIALHLSEVQRTLDQYFMSKRTTILLRPFSTALALVHPIYLILTRINFLDFLTGIIGSVNIVLYFAYIMGLIICFAKREMLTVTVALGLKTLLEIIDLFIYRIGFNSVLSVIAYALVTVVAYRCYRNNTEY